MKKWGLLVLCLLSLSTVCAQHKYKVYSRLIAREMFADIHIRELYIDYGQPDIEKNKQNNYLVDEEGNKIDFRTMSAAMNYMSKIGWELEQIYVRSVPDDITYVVWVLSKEVSSDSEITQGFQTRLMYEKSKK